MLHKLGKRGVAEVLYDLYGLPISLGAVIDSQREMSEALAEPYVEIVEHAQAAPIKNADETSWIEGKGKKAKVWLWTLVTASAIIFMIQRTRATNGALKLLLNGRTPIGELVFGVLGTDRHGAYNFWPLERRHALAPRVTWAASCSMRPTACLRGGIGCETARCPVLDSRSTCVRCALASRPCSPRV